MKILKIILDCVLVASVLLSFVSCGKSDTEESTTTPIAPETTVSSVDADATVSETQSNTTPSTTASDTPVAIQGATEQPYTNPVSSTNAEASASVVPQTENNTPPPSTPPATDPAPTPTGVETVSFTDGDLTRIVYYPAEMKTSNKKYPILSWANGTMCPPDMYKDLLTLMAEGGYIVIANSDTMSADGSTQRSSIDFLIAESNNSQSIFYNKLQTSKIGAIGHSQGGRSSVNASVADSRISCVLSLAGSNYLEEAEPLSAPTLFLTGTADMVVSSSQWVEPAYNVAKGPAVYASLNKGIHTTCCTNASAYSYYAIKWFDAWLKNDNDAKNIFKENGEMSKDSAWVDFRCKGF